MQTVVTLVQKSAFQLFSGYWGIMIFGIFIAAFALAGAVADLTSPIYEAADVIYKIQQIKIDAISFGVAVFCIMIAYPRPAFLKRASLAILVACFCWLIAWSLCFAASTNTSIYKASTCIKFFKTLIPWANRESNARQGL